MVTKGHLKSKVLLLKTIGRVKAPSPGSVSPVKKYQIQTIKNILELMNFDVMTAPFKDESEIFIRIIIRDPRTLIKFIYSEEATKIWRNLQILFDVNSKFKKTFGDFVNFLWPSEYMNFMLHRHTNTYVSIAQWCQNLFEVEFTFSHDISNIFDVLKSSKLVR